MHRDQQDKIMRGSCEVYARFISVPIECQSECHMVLDKWHSGLYNYVVVNASPFCKLQQTKIFIIFLINVSALSTLSEQGCGAPEKVLFLLLACY